MNGLSLCAGVGGLDLAIEIAFPEYRCIAAVENNPEAARRFRRRFPHAKVFQDVVGFNGRPLHGIVDCVVAGWPCQPHSVAGKRRGTADERWIWNDIARILDECGAPLFFGENVSGLLRDTDSPTDSDEDMDEPPNDAIGGMGTVLRDLAEMGFVSSWGSLRAAQVGASHGRNRVFILAYHPGQGFRIDRSAWDKPGQPNECNSILAYARDAERWPVVASDQDRSGRADSILAHTKRRTPGERGQPASREEIGQWSHAGSSGSGGILADTCQPGFARSEFNELPGADGNHEGGAVTELRGASVEDSPWVAIQTGGRRSGRGRRIRGAGNALFAPGPSDPAWPDILRTSPHLAPALSPVTAAIALALQQGTLDLQAEIEPQLCG